MAVKKVAKQMEMFDDGGLKEEGGTIDPISGNDVPPGSTQEEVRDDIPAQLSEGEFVFPADVVRFIGLEKLMMMRQEAKMGLKKMEDMGQMGNSEEATMPDDMPFSLEDLDMEDDEPMQEDDSMEMAEGGFVMIAGQSIPVSMLSGQLPPITTKPMPETKNMAVGGFMNPTGTYQVPTNIATQPSYFQNYAQSTAPFSPFNQTQTPIGTPLSTNIPVVGQTGQGPSFNTLMPQLTGKRETLEYRNDAGQKLFIPFIDGKPIYPIPEGYTKYTAEKEVTPEKRPTVQSTSVRQDQSDNVDPDVLSGTNQVRGLDNSIVSTDFANQTPDKVAQNMANMSSADRAISVQNAMQKSYGYTGFAKGAQQLATAFIPGALASKMIGQKTINPMDVLSQVGQPDMGTRDAITNAFGYDEKGYDMDDPMDASLAGIDQQNAINTAMFGGKVEGTEDKSRGGIAGITITDIQKEYGIAPSYTSRGNKDVQIVRGTNPGQISKTGVFYDAGGRGNSLNAAYSSLSAMMNYMSLKSHIGYRGSPGMARYQAKLGNKKAIAVVNAMKQDDKFIPMREDNRSESEVSQGLQDAQTSAVAAADEAVSQATGGKTTSSTGFTDQSAFGDSPGGGYSGDVDSGFGISDEDAIAKGSLVTKRKASGKIKKKYMKRGGLASR